MDQTQSNGEQTEDTKKCSSGKCPICRYIHWIVLGIIVVVGFLYLMTNIFK